VSHTHSHLGHTRTGMDPKMLEAVPRGLLEANGSAPIHMAHVLGLPHAGVYMVVRDSIGQLLLLQRASQLKTCANTWGFLGEHLLAGEDEATAVKRALDEEMGPSLRHDHLHQLVNLSNVWYAQVYEDGRKERQATYIWLVQLQDESHDIHLRPDDEVARYKWVPQRDVLKMVGNITHALSPSLSHTHTHSHTHSRTCTRTRAHTHTCAHTHPHTCRYTLTHTLAHTHAHAHAHAHAHT